MSSSSVSVVVATYNGGKFIEEQLYSLINQIRVPDEIVIIDDCSTDSTLSIVEDFESKNATNIVIVKNEINKGVCQTFIDGLKVTTKDVVFLCDQDDIWKPNRISDCLKYFENSKTNLLLSNAVLINSEGKVFDQTLWGSIGFSPTSYKLLRDESLRRFWLLKEILKRNYYTGMCMVFRRQLIDRLEYIPCYMLHDRYIGLLAIFNGEIEFNSNQLVKYRQHMNNQVGANKRKSFEGVALTANLIVESTRNMYNCYKEMTGIVEKYGTKKEINYMLNGLNFYKKRTEIVERRIIGNLLFIISQQKNYLRFTSRSEHAIIKDLVVTLFFDKGAIKK